ncbi:MAG: cytochrome-c oxidase, cbb3-type subunit III [Siculibacillus sp.]
MAQQELDHLSGQSTTGHEWDGLKELNTPLPKWWLYVFYACIVWAIGYTFFYPAWPLITDYTKGVFGAQIRVNSIADYENGKAARLANAAGLAEAPLEKIKSTPAFLEFAMANGKAAFGDNCAPCHGSGATGGPGFPSLQDDDWLWGGKLADIYQTLQYGIRSGHAKQRDMAMPAFGKDGLLKKEEIAAVASYVVSLSDASVKATDDGKKIYADNCASCHADDGKGNMEMGAPNLTDKIWLYGASVDKVAAQISEPALGVMPAWEGRLDPVTIKSLAVYIHSLGGGK